MTETDLLLLDLLRGLADGVYLAPHARQLLLLPQGVVIVGFTF